MALIVLIHISASVQKDFSNNSSLSWCSAVCLFAAERTWWSLFLITAELVFQGQNPQSEDHYTPEQSQTVRKTCSPSFIQHTDTHTVTTLQGATCSPGAVTIHRLQYLAPGCKPSARPPPRCWRDPHLLTNRRQRHTMQNTLAAGDAVVMATQ